MNLSNLMKVCFEWIGTANKCHKSNSAEALHGVPTSVKVDADAVCVQDMYYIYYSTAIFSAARQY